MANSYRLTGASDSKSAWLSDLRNSIPVHFIGTERLTTSSTERTTTVRQIARTTPERTVRQYSDKLAKQVQQKLHPQSLDRTFPAACGRAALLWHPPEQLIIVNRIDLLQRLGFKNKSLAATMSTDGLVAAKGSIINAGNTQPEQIGKTRYSVG